MDNMNENVSEEMENVPTIVIEQENGQHKKRGALTVGVSLAVVAALGLGGTLAYLTYTTNKAENRFTSDQNDKPMNVTADLLEPKWDDAVTAEKRKPENEQAKSSDNKVIPEKASRMLPGYSVDKDPFIVNTTENGGKAFVGMKLQFVKWNGSDYVAMSATEVDQLLAVYTLTSNNSRTATGLDLNQSDWTQIVNSTDDGYTFPTTAGHAGADGAMYFYYNNKLSAETGAQAQGEATAPLTADMNDEGGTGKITTKSLFTRLAVAQDATQSAIDTLYETLKGSITDADPATPSPADFPGWKVEITGAAIGADGLPDSYVPSDFVTGKSMTWKKLLDVTPATGDPAVPNKSGVRKNI